MSRYNSDMNKVVYLFESGTYAGSMSPLLFSGPACSWLGQVQDLSINEAEGKIETRYLGASSRDFEEFTDGPIDITGTLTYNPQDMNLFFHALGSVYEVPDGTSTNVLYVSGTSSNSQQNPFVSGTATDPMLPYCFGLEDSKQTPGTGANFIRLIRGCVINTATLNLAQGEKASVDIDWIANHIVPASGVTTTLGSNVFNRSYLWSDASLVIGGVGAAPGSTVNTAKSIALEVNQNVTPPHYLNGSRTAAAPYMGNRNYTLTVTADMDDTLRAFYEKFYKGGSDFHGTLDLAVDPILEGVIGSQHVTFNMSGCIVTSMDNPSALEGVNETTIEIRPKIVDGQAWQDERYVGSANPF